MMPWIYAELSYFEMAEENLDEALKYMSLSRSHAGSYFFGALASMKVEVPLLLLQGRYEEAEKKSTDFFKVLQEKVTDESDVDVEMKYNQLIAAVGKRDRKKIKKIYSEFKALVAKFPILKYLDHGSDAILNVSEGKFKDSDLDPAKELAGQYHVLIRFTEQAIERLLIENQVK